MEAGDQIVKESGVFWPYFPVGIVILKFKLKFGIFKASCWLELRAQHLCSNHPLRLHLNLFHLWCPNYSAFKIEFQEENLFNSLSLSRKSAQKCRAGSRKVSSFLCLFHKQIVLLNFMIFMHSSWFHLVGGVHSSFIENRKSEDVTRLTVNVDLSWRPRFFLANRN